ncbi:MAG: hypothetical protein QM754_00615 [Tepidisphaeraceae bacterium]
MTEAEAQACVVRLYRVFPRTPDADERVDAIRDEFRRWPADAVRRAISERVGIDDFANVPAIIARVRELAPPPAAPRDTGPAVRVNGLTASDRAADRAAGEKLEADAVAALAFVASLAPDERKKLHARVCEGVSGCIRSIYERGNPLTSRPLALEIFKISRDR